MSWHLTAGDYYARVETIQRGALDLVEYSTRSGWTLQIVWRQVEILEGNSQERNLYPSLGPYEIQDNRNKDAVAKKKLETVTTCNSGIICVLFYSIFNASLCYKSTSTTRSLRWCFVQTWHRGRWAHIILGGISNVDGNAHESNAASTLGR